MLVLQRRAIYVPSMSGVWDVQKGWAIVGNNERRLHGVEHTEHTDMDFNVCAVSLSSQNPQLH